MLQKVSPEIEADVLAEYDRDYIGFSTRVFKEMERTNPGLAELLVTMQDEVERVPGILLGIQMAFVVYRQLEKASARPLPLVEIGPTCRSAASEALSDPGAFLDQYGTPYFRNGLIGKRTVAACIGDALGNEVAWELVLFVVVFMIRILELQYQLDLAKRPYGTH